jgi:hypothetical protein
VVKAERANWEEIMKAEGASRRRETASIADCPIISVETVQQRRRDQYISNAVSIDTLPPNALNSQEPRVSSICETLVKNTQRRYRLTVRR